MIARLYKAGEEKTLRFEVPCPSYITWGRELIAIDLQGAQEAWRAVWANLRKGRTERSLTPTEVLVINGAQQEWVQIKLGQKYHFLQAPGEVGARGALLCHEDFDRLHYRLLMGGDLDTPPPHWHLVAGEILEIPSPGSWLSALWSYGLDDELIQELDVWGDVRAWRIVNITYKWDELIGKLVRGRICV